MVMNEAVLCRSSMVPYSLLCIVALPLARSPSSAADGSGSPAGYVVLTAPLYLCLFVPVLSFVFLNIVLCGNRDWSAVISVPQALDCVLLAEQGHLQSQKRALLSLYARTDLCLFPVTLRLKQTGRTVTLTTWRRRR